MTRAQLASLTVVAGPDATVGGLLSMQRAIGIAVRAARRVRGWSQERLAAESGLHRPVIARIEYGHHAPYLSTLCAVSAALEVPLSQLVAAAEDAQAICAEGDEHNG